MAERRTTWWCVPITTNPDGWFTLQRGRFGIQVVHVGGVMKIQLANVGGNLCVTISSNLFGTKMDRNAKYNVTASDNKEALVEFGQNFSLNLAEFGIGPGRGASDRFGVKIDAVSAHLGVGFGDCVELEVDPAGFRFTVRRAR